MYTPNLKRIMKIYNTKSGCCVRCINIERKINNKCTCSCTHTYDDDDDDEYKKIDEGGCIQSEPKKIFFFFSDLKQFHWCEKPLILILHCREKEI